VSESVEIVVNGRMVMVDAGSTVAAALLSAGDFTFRISSTGEPRGALCGMGVCYECRATIDGVEQRRSCLVRVRPGMRVDTATETTP
jgi:predicted molibdopterin-dependent oxidoreductase YjgC